MQLLLETVNVLKDLFDTLAVPVDLILESLNRLKPSSESRGLSESSKGREASFLAVSPPLGPNLSVSHPPECDGLTFSVTEACQR